MGLLGSSKKNGMKEGCTGCGVTSWVVAILLLLTTVAAGVSLFKAHFANGNMIWATPNGSLAIIAFVMAVVCLKKSLKCCCGCGSCPTK